MTASSALRPAADAVVPPRPARLVALAGTATEIGKTWVACELLRHWRRRGLAVAARKPAQSFEAPDRDGTITPVGTDAQLLADATGETPHSVCPPHRWYPAAMAPPMAADVLHEPAFRLADLIDELSWPPGIDVGIVETAGGVRSPLADDADCAEFAAAAGADVAVLVADAGLGTINAVRLSVDALAPGLPVVVFLNRYDDGDELHRRNRDWLEQRDGFETAVASAQLAERLSSEGPSRL